MKKLLCMLLLCFSSFSADEFKPFPSIPKIMLNSSHRIAAMEKGGKTSHGAGVSADLSEYGLSGPRYIITCAHVVVEDGKAIKSILVEIGGGRKEWCEATVIAYDEQTDVAILETNVDMPEIANLAKDDSLDIGDAIIAVGSPRATAISANLGYLADKNSGDGKKRRYQGSMAVTHGNSGGPVFDPNKKEIVGIVTSIYDTADNAGTPNIGFFLSTPQIKEFLTDHKDDFGKYLEKKKKKKD